VTDVPRRASTNSSGLFICVGGFTSPCGNRERGMVYCLSPTRRERASLCAFMIEQSSYCKSIEAVGAASLPDDSRLRCSIVAASTRVVRCISNLAGLLQAFNTMLCFYHT